MQLRHNLNLSFRPEAVRQRQNADELAFVDSILVKFPSSLHSFLRHKWLSLRGINGEGLAAANTWLRKHRDSLNDIPYCPDLAADYEQLKALAKIRANEMHAVYARERLGFFGMQIIAEENAAARTINYALNKYHAPVEGKSMESAVYRLTNPDFWARKLCVNQKQASELEQIKAGLVNKFISPYVSNEQLLRFRSQRVRNKNMLESTMAVNDIGQEFTLADLVARSVSNPEIKMAELITRVAGIEEIAQGIGHCGLFITVTCPSKFHPQKLSSSGKRSVRNEKYEDLSPKQAQSYLCDVWALLRTALSNRGVEMFGIRVVEPHHDGCPHWHMLMFVEPRHRGLVVRLFRRYFRAMDKHEPMAWKHRFNVKDIDWSRGSAAGYLIKYLCKNIDGVGMTDAQGFSATDFDSGLDVTNAAELVNAWASCWNIRQFQFIGTVPIGIYRECRRIDFDVSEEFAAAVDAADKGNWAEFTRILKVDRIVLLKKDNGLNKYREPVQKVNGIIHFSTGDSIITRTREWELIFQGGSSFELPRNIVCNCTLPENNEKSDLKHSLDSDLKINKLMILPLPENELSSIPLNFAHSASPALRLGG